MRNFREIIELTQKMMNEQGPTLRLMREIRDRYDGDWVIPVPSVSTEPVLPPLTPQLIGEVVDTMAMRAASVRPTIFSPAIDPNKDTGKRSRAYAMQRRKIISATYHTSRWQLGIRRFYRQLAAYHTGSICVVPNFDKKMPSIEVRDPLSTFVEPQGHEQLRDPSYVAFVTRHSGAYLRAMYPQVRSERRGPISEQDTSQLWDVVEWYDLDQVVWGLVGPVHPGAHVNADTVNNAPWMQLSPAYMNKVRTHDGEPVLPCVVPHNVALGRVASRIGSLIGNVDLQAKIAALDVLAQEKAIFPDMYAIGRSNGLPGIVGGQWKDGREGEINILQDIEQVGMLRSTPDARTSETLSRLERNFRVSTGLSGMMTGENNSSLRTGRAIDSLAGMSLDPRIQEVHEVYEAYGAHLNTAILATWLGYWPDEERSIISGWSRGGEVVKFTPSEHIETTDNIVSYALAGADVVQQTQIFGSMYGSGAMSLTTFRTKHPLIDDPDLEGRLVDEELFERALRDSLIQKLAAGELPVMLAVKIRDHMQKGMDIFAAAAKADEEMRELQATPAPAAPPGMIAAPEAMPGLEAGPGGMQQPMPVEEPQVQEFGDVGRFRQLMQTMGAA